MNGPTEIPSFDRILMFLSSEDSEIRVAAADVLGRLGDRRAVEPLFKACLDEEIRVKQAALEALSRLGTHSR
jgi:HEAT repeat protein